MKKGFTTVHKVLLWGGVALLLVVTLAFLWDNLFRTQQSQDPQLPKIRFQGEYRIGEGHWQPVTPGGHISVLRGDVTLRGKLRVVSPKTGEDLGPVEAGTPVALYCNHISLEISEGEDFSVLCDPENPQLGDDACGAFWTSYETMGGESITLRIRNPHSFGNRNAADRLLADMAVYAGGLFEEDVRSRGNLERGIAMAFLLSGMVLLGIAIFALLVHLKKGRDILFVGAVTMFAGLYYLFDSPGISFFNDNYAVNTAMLGLSMMFYMLMIDALAVSLLDSFSAKLGRLAVVYLGVLQVVITGLPLFSSYCFYDLWFVWVVLQSVVSVVLMSCLLYTLRQTVDKRRKLLLVGSLLPMGAFLLDVLATVLGWWQGGESSKLVFAGVFVAIIFLVMRVIPENINAISRAKEMETERQVLQAELQRSRVATMMSQIQPHFIYNTLSSIEMLCMEKPREAARLVHNFGEYLQGNFRHVEDTALIPFSREIDHVKHYTDIEQVRFEDMTIRYELQGEDFMIPPLTVQPLVENAIKHGLMGLEEGGTVTIRTEQTPEHYCITVIDDGVGFDVKKLAQEKKGVGISNIRGRLEAMCSGALEIESEPGKGTVARIRIPKL